MESSESLEANTSVFGEYVAFGWSVETPGPGGGLGFGAGGGRRGVGRRRGFPTGSMLINQLLQFSAWDKRYLLVN